MIFICKIDKQNIPIYKGRNKINCPFCEALPKSKVDFKKSTIVKQKLKAIQ